MYSWICTVSRFPAHSHITLSGDQDSGLWNPNTKAIFLVLSHTSCDLRQVPKLSELRLFICLNGDDDACRHRPDARITGLNTGQEHHCLMWTPALSYEKALPACLQIKQLRLRKMTWLAQGHGVIKTQDIQLPTAHQPVSLTFQSEIYPDGSQSR